MDLSIISPVYGAPQCIKELVSQIEKAASKITEDFEIILVEDNSPDDSKDIIREVCRLNNKVKGIFLSRNFGEQSALNAGFDASSGEWVVTLDCDLQNPPSAIVDLYNKAKEGYDVVYASRQNKQHAKVDMIGSSLFNRLLSYLTDMRQDSSIAEYVIYHRRVVDAMKGVGDFVRYYPLINRWVGFKSAKIPVPHNVRGDASDSSYTLRKKISLALKIATTFSTKPLRLIAYFGGWLTFFFVVIAIIIVIPDLIYGVRVNGWLTLFVSMWIIGGVLITIMGVLAVYIGNIFNEVKKRPSYIVSERINF